jgi:DNA topoisomerase-3
VTAKTEMKIAVGDFEEFTLRGVSVLEKGWTKYDDSTVKDKMLPPLKKGDAVNVDFKPQEKETSPPKHYTIETLNQYLKNPFKEEKAARDKAEKEKGEEDEREDDTEDYRAMLEGVELGTEATRTGIIDNARSSGYIQLKKDVYTILPEGEFFIRALSRLGIRMDKFKTCEMGRSLKKIYRGEIPVSSGVALAEAEIREVFGSAKNGTSPDIGFMGDEVGTCPLCGGRVRRTKFGYGCEAFREKGCKFSFNMKILGRTIPIGEARRILSEGRSEVLQGFRSKKGTLFAAALKLENGRVDFDFASDRPAPADGGAE